MAHSSLQWGFGYTVTPHNCTCNEASANRGFGFFRAGVKELRVELPAEGNDLILLDGDPVELMDRSRYVILKIAVFHRGLEAGRIHGLSFFG
jgi:hypothetical protein